MNLDRKPHFIISQMLLHLPEGAFDFGTRDIGSPRRVIFL